jgi:hypothetical protein
MKKLVYKFLLFSVSGLLLLSVPVMAQSEQTTAGNPPIAQPLVREGDFAVKLSDALKLGTVTNETEAENLLGTAGIVPKNGWIADYPVTPDILGELQASVADAAAAGKLAMGKDAAMKATQDVAAGYNLSIRTDAPAPQGGTAPVTNNPESPVINNYYYDEGPPVVTYYSPPPDYAYMYSWVPYPFWGWGFWYPGFFVLVDFHVRVHGHGDRDDFFVSNHFRDSRTGGITRIDPANRSRGGTFPVGGGRGLTSPSARSGAQAIVNSSQGRASMGTSRVFRGYGDRPSSGTRTSAFDHSRNSRFERAASDRGFQSRSTAGRIAAAGRGNRGGGGVSRGAPRRDSGGGGSRGDGGGGYHGGGRR